MRSTRPTPAIEQRYTVHGTALVSRGKTFETEIGDTKQTDFHPQVKIKRWDNEANFSVRLLTREPATVAYEDHAVVWASTSLEAKFYDVGGFEDDGGFEFEVRLFTRPASNRIDFSLQTKALDFLYQPPLANVETNGDTWEPYKHGGTLRRPAAAAGSYAVYHVTQRGDFSKVGGQNYRAGKAFHIFRPWAEDATGARVWCDLHIDAAAGLLTITVPQGFLDGATYPVLIDPTFGYTSIGATEATGQFFVNRLYGGKAAPASSGTVDSVTAYTRTGTTTNSFKGVITASDKTIITNGVSNPKTLNDVGAGTAAWFTATMPTPPSVTGGTDYYVCMVGGGTDVWGSLVLDTGAPAASAVYDSSNNFTTPTNPTDGSDEAERPSIYATYTSGPMTPPAGSLVLTGQTPGVVSPSGSTVTPSAGSLALSGNAPSALAGAVAQPPAGNLTLTGVSVGLAYQGPDVGRLVLTGYAPALGYSRAVPVGALALTGLTPSAVLSLTLATQAGALMLTGAAPAALQSGNTFTIPVGALVLTGTAPAAVLGLNAAPTAGALTLTGLAPTVAVESTSAIPSGSLVLTGTTSTLSIVQGPVSLEVPLGSLRLGGIAPSLFRLAASPRDFVNVPSVGRWFDV